MGQFVRGEEGSLSEHPEVFYGRIGVVLINLGTPDGADYWSVRRYLREFLSDRRIIEMNRFLWFFILNFLVLTFRPHRSRRAYEKIWDHTNNESPLRRFTRAQAVKLSSRLAAKDSGIIVDWAMRYGQPGISEVLTSLKEKGCTKILCFPLYPQYSATTTGTVNDEVFRGLMKMRWQPTLRIVHPYYDNPVYIDAIVKSLKSAIAGLNFEPERVIISFHGLPKSFLEKGDPYYCHCSKTTRLIRSSLERSSDEVIMTFQSRFGLMEWLKPYTDETIERLAKEGVRKLVVITPGFVSDCIETLEEIAIENGNHFKAHGGTHFASIPCLNESDLGIGVLEHIVYQELSGWV